MGSTNVRVVGPASSQLPETKRGPTATLNDEIGWAIRHVLRSPARLRFLAAEGLGVPVRLLRFLRRIVPLASVQLDAISGTGEGDSE